jgi:hypothetical protein
MDLSGPLVGVLRALTDALEDPDIDLPTILDGFVEDLAAVIPSYLGLQATLQLDGRPVTLSVIEDADAGAARTSLRLPLDPSGRADPASAVILCAANPGAFVDLAADAERWWGLDGRVNHNQHLPAPADRPDSATDDLHQLSDINRAIGVLLTQNFTPGTGPGTPPPDRRGTPHHPIHRGGAHHLQGQVIEAGRSVCSRASHPGR